MTCDWYLNTKPYDIIVNISVNSGIITANFNIILEHRILL